MTDQAPSEPATPPLPRFGARPTLALSALAALAAGAVLYVPALVASLWGITVAGALGIGPDDATWNDGDLWIMGSATAFCLIVALAILIPGGASVARWLGVRARRWVTWVSLAGLVAALAVVWLGVIRL